MTGTPQHIPSKQVLKGGFCLDVWASFFTLPVIPNSENPVSGLTSQAPKTITGGWRLKKTLGIHFLFSGPHQKEFGC